VKRLHLFEFNERPECPRFIRDSVVETLGTGLRWSKMGNIAGPNFSRFCQTARCQQVLDLCTGTGVPVGLIISWLRNHNHPTPHFVLSDLFPNHASFERIEDNYGELVTPHRESVDAMAVKSDLSHDARAIFNSFHHFTPEMGTRILKDTVQNRKSIFIYEGFTRSLTALGPTGPHMLASLLTNPLFAPSQRLLKALFTYLLPIIPLAAFWDGMVSSVRIHSESELHAMAAAVDESYTWQYDEVPYPLGGRALTFTGIPNERLSS